MSLGPPPTPRRQQVLFARINRRPQQPLELRPFKEVILSLVENRNTKAEHSGKTWIAGDLEVREDVLVGVIGFVVDEMITQFDLTEWSWLKGTRRIETGATTSTLAPFAIDLRAKGRWVAFSPKGHLNAKTFPGGFHAVLSEALKNQNELFFDWDIDMVSSSQALREWVSQHPRITKMSLNFRFDNPGRDLSSDREQMRALGSRKMEKIFHPAPRSTLHVDAELDELSEELDRTDLDIELTAKEGNGEVKFNTKSSREVRFVDDFSDDLSLGMDHMQEQLLDFIDGRAFPTLTGDPADEEGE